MGVNLKIRLFSFLFLAFYHTVLSWFNVYNLLPVSKTSREREFRVCSFSRIGNRGEAKLPFARERKTKYVCLLVLKLYKFSLLYYIINEGWRVAFCSSDAAARPKMVCVGVYF